MLLHHILTVVPFVRVISTVVLAVSLERRLDTATAATFELIWNFEVYMTFALLRRDSYVDVFTISFYAKHNYAICIFVAFKTHKKHKNFTCAYLTDWFSSCSTKATGRT